MKAIYIIVGEFEVSVSDNICHWLYGKVKCIFFYFIQIIVASVTFILIPVITHFSPFGEYVVNCT